MSENKIQSFSINVTTTDAIIKYLSGRPYVEVEHLIVAIRTEYQAEAARLQEAVTTTSKKETK